ncbi:MAG: cupin domain-containing protein [FCB group bacterium]|nr:cupin domain-containing protein [FCB group bacterium]
MKNIFSKIPTELSDEVMETLVKDSQLKIERIVSRGQVSPPGFWYDQDFNEWVIVLKGRAELRFSGEETKLRLNPGDYVEIPAHRKHRVEWTDPDVETIWLSIHWGGKDTH